MNAETRSIERAATQWLVLADAGMAPAQEAEFHRWLETDRRHAAAYEALSQTWTKLDRVRDSALAPFLEAELDELPIAGRAARAHSPVAWLTVLGAAAALVVAYAGWWQTAGTPAAFADVAATEIGGVRTLDLPDHSIVRLNTDSAVKIQFTRTERRVTLVRGEAFFTVAKDAARPFLVSAGGIDVRAVGTAFNVRLRAEHIEVVVTEGKVQVRETIQGTSLVQRSAAGTTLTPGGEALLIAGESVAVPVVTDSSAIQASVAPAAIAAVDIERVLAWRDQRLVFVSTPLAEIVAEFNRYNRHKLVIGSAALATRRFGGAFHANDPKTFVHLLEASFGVVPEEREGETHLRVTLAAQ